MRYLPVFCWEQTEDYAKRLHGFYGKGHWRDSAQTTHKYWRRIARDNIPVKRLMCDDCVYLYRNFVKAKNSIKHLDYYDCVCDNCLESTVCMGKSSKCIFEDCQSARR